MLKEPVYVAFPTKTLGSYTIGIEKMSNTLERTRELIAEHWGETEALYRQLHGDPNFLIYMALEQEGKFVMFTARHNETNDLIGHLMYYVYESTHTMGIMEAREDTFFVSKDHRGGRLASGMVDYAEQCFRKMRVHQMTMSCKSPAGGPNLDKFLKRKGYNPVAIAYFKPLVGEE